MVLVVIDLANRCVGTQCLVNCPLFWKNINAEFRREIVQVYLAKYGNPLKSAGRPSTTIAGSRVSESIRFDNISHFIQKIVKKRRCAGDRCKHKTSAARTQCGKCNLGLCVECFEGFHTNKKCKYM